MRSIALDADGGIEHAERFERVHARAGERKIALVITRLQIGARRRRFGKRHRKTRTIERNGKACADEPSAGNQDVAVIDHGAMITARGVRRRVDRSSAVCVGLRWYAARFVR